MATLPLFSYSVQEKLSDDTDAGRLNNYPSIIRDNAGKYTIFYEKTLASGKITGGVVSFTPGTFNCAISLGTGEINTIPVTWSNTNLVLSPNTYTLIYVTPSGIVSFTDDFPISLIKDSILLAFVNVGSSEIVRVSNIEKNGYYVYYKTQVLSGGIYVWDNYEYKLNTGQKPVAQFDLLSDKIYLTYQRDNLAYLRIINVNDPLSWEDINHSQDIGGTLYPVPPPKNNVNLFNSMFAGNNSIITPELFPLSYNVFQGFRKSGMTITKYLHLPYINGIYVNSITNSPEIEIFTKIGANYVLETSYPASTEELYAGINTFWATSTGIKYVGAKVKHLLYNQEYRTHPRDYKTFYIQANRDYIELIGSAYNATIKPEVFLPMVSNSLGTWEKTMEFEQVYGFNDDSGTMAVSNSLGTWEKTMEFEQVYGFNDDSSTVSISMSMGINTINNI